VNRFIWLLAIVIIVGGAIGFLLDWLLGQPTGVLVSIPICLVWGSLAAAYLEAPQ
jgi:hypothetical protein